MNKRTENNTQNVDVLVHLRAPFMTSGAFSLEIDCIFIYHAIDATLFSGGSNLSPFSFKYLNLKSLSVSDRILKLLLKHQFFVKHTHSTVQTVQHQPKRCSTNFSI